MKADELDKLERLVERQMDLLADLPPEEAPRPAHLARVEAAVRAEAARQGRRTTAFPVLPRWATVAAAVLLAVGLTGVFTRSSGSAWPRVGDAELLAVWTEAVGQSSDTVTFLLDNGWMLNGADVEDGEQTEVDGCRESLEQSFEQFETL